MSTNPSIQDTMSCGLAMTNSARTGIKQWAADEHAFFALQEFYDVYIEKRPMNQHGNMSFSLFFDNETNYMLSKQLTGRVAVLECIYKNEGFLATGFRVRGRKEPVRTNRRHRARLKFHIGRTGIAMPVELYTSLRALPIAEERSAYVKKRIASWEGYLRIEEKNADVADITTSFSSAIVNADFSKVNLVCNRLSGKELRRLTGFSVKLEGLQDEIGNVINVNRSKRVIEIELNRKYKELARRGSWIPRNNQEVIFSNFAELSQVRRLRKGFKDLQDGLAANANLEKILFEERPTVQISKREIDLDFHNELNEFQQEAVKGAMTSNDLYVIQGPPGTGKTTVISEICYQNAKAGLRTLVASQSNLAVDNALGRLLSNQDIRILRFGRTESIEEEGKKFIEENVALNWKNETLDTVNEQRKTHTVKEKQVDIEIEQCEKNIQNLQAQLVILEEKINIKKATKVEHVTWAKELQKLKKSRENIQQEYEDLEVEQARLKQLVAQYDGEIDRIKHFFQTNEISPEEINKMEEVAQKIKTYRHTISHYETIETMKETENTLEMIREKIDMSQPQYDKLHSSLKGIQSITKLDELKKHLDAYGVVPPITINLQINELNRLITLIKLGTYSYEFSEWKELNERLVTAIGKIEQLLMMHQFPMHMIKSRDSKKYQTVNDMHDMLDQIGRFLINPATKRLLDRRNTYAQKESTLKEIANNLAFLYGKKDDVSVRATKIKEQLYRQVKQNYASIQKELTQYVNQSLITIEREKSTLQQDIEEEQSKLNDLRQKALTLQTLAGSSDEELSKSDVQEKLKRQEQLYSDFEQKKAALKQYAVTLAEQRDNVQEAAEQLETTTEALKLVQQKSDSLDKEVLEHEHHLRALAEVLAQNPEVQHEQTLMAIHTLVEKETALKKEEAKMPIIHGLQNEWRSLLTEATDYDLDEIRKLYVQHANVIGTTCVASARREFIEDYPTFDVVIIDEVSKATPPELLLPMLKGKKIILVGDHHQLPPLMGHETLDELIEESSNSEEKKELRKLLSESLFERLFRTLPTQNKTMLGIQYRMHESIMETITPFYEEGNYSLQCGVIDSNRNRDHLLESRYVQREDHLLWFDMPNTPTYFEEQVKGGTSRFNQAELEKIRELLMDLEQATEEAKRNGRMKEEEKKSVGIISFYGEQVKRIDRLIQHELIPKQLHCRTGSVDKFQGMEMDVIILSFVRNHQQKGGDIGFAKDYRRLNVALSRARELLIIVGSSEMFTLRPKQEKSREMYRRLLENVKMKDGFRNTEDHVKS